MKIIQQYVSWREKFLPLAVEKIKKTYIAILHPNRVPWNETTDSLARFKKGTLGNKLYQFLKEGNIELEPKYEAHDVYHVITGYGLGLNNEARMFFFLFGNGKKSTSILGSMLVAIIFMPDKWLQFIKDYKRGKEYESIKDLDFENILDIDFIVLEDQLYKY